MIFRFNAKNAISSENNLDHSHRSKYIITSVNLSRLINQNKVPKIKVIYREQQ